MQVVSQEALFLYFLHEISDGFDQKAVLKGGMALRLLNTDRYTNDLDYCFAPYTSKKQIEKEFDQFLEKKADVTYTKSVNSKSIRYVVEKNGFSIQIEIQVAKTCPSIPVNTEALAKPLNESVRIIRIMSFDISLAHKIAAWNERRLLRDLYDIYFIWSQLKEKPKLSTLEKRLQKVQSRIPKLKKIKKMKISELVIELEETANHLSQKAIEKELGPILSKVQLAGLEKKIKLSLSELIAFLKPD